MIKTYLSHQNIQALAFKLANQINALHLDKKSAPSSINVYPIPRGGIPVVYLLKGHTRSAINIVDSPNEAEVFVDDIIDSGKTMQRYCDKYPGKPFFALLDKNAPLFEGKWIVFPWETREEDNDESATDNVVRLLQYIGEDADREGLRETPARVVKAWRHWASGYGVDIPSLLKVFEDGGENYDEMVIVRDIPIYSKCEHHLADIFGTASIAYIPNGRIVGLSKLSRVADAFARRLQVQERLTSQIADALNQHLQPKGVGVIVRARHMCMESRGINQQGHHTITSALRGVLKDDPAKRAEFMRLVS